MSKSLRYFFVAAVLLLSARLFAQKQYNCLDWKTNVTVNTYLIQKMHQQYDARRKELAGALTSKKETEKYIRNVRAKFGNLLGDFPSDSPLHPRITGTLDRDDYKIEKVIFESFPHHHVTANLYIPGGKGKFPAALFFCGHENTSKATESYQKTAILFAKNGFVVFVIDPVSQSERFQLTDSTGKPLTRGGTTAHTLMNEGSNLVGTSVPEYELWDNKRALDYLETRPEVDTSRIGCLGNSGGGMQTIYFAAFDNRVKVFAPCSYLSNREKTFELTGAADGCAQIPGEGKDHFELSDYLISAAPKRILVLAGRYDFIDYRGTLLAFNDLKEVYRSLGEAQKIKFFTYDDGHGISKPKREAALSWFRKWLCNDSTKVIEGDLNTLPEKDLLCTNTGQVSSQFPDEVSIADRNLSLFNKYRSKREEFLKQDKNSIQNKIADLVGLDLSNNDVSVEKKGNVKSGTLAFEKLIIRKKNQIPLPVLWLHSPNKTPQKIIVWLPQEGKNEIAAKTSLLQSYLDKNYSVLLCDVSGTGETEDNPNENDKKYYNKEYRNCALALHLGMSMVGIRTADILTVMDFIASVPEFKNIPVEINANGFVAVSALHAALFNQRISELKLYNTINSYKTVLENPVEKNWYSYVINDVLEYYDLPDLAQLIGRNKIYYLSKNREE